VSASYPPLIQALRDPARYPHPVERVEIVETHISWVLLAGDYAYKIKKPVDLGFLDFSTLTKRREYCAAELRLNRRLAPKIYLDVVGISGTPAAPVLGGTGTPFEYAVKMAQFPQAAQLDRVAARGELGREHMDLLAAELAAFHARVAVAGPESPFGTPEHVFEPVAENFRQIRARVASDLHAQLDRLEAWSRAQYAHLTPTFLARKRDGFVRECHGDAHLANMALLDGEIVLFDCIEFSDNLRWIDVMNELAFAVMDLDDRGHPELGRRLLNAYLEITGDYAGLDVFRFYQVYRALVRAKVAAIHLAQPGLDAGERERALVSYRSYADLAERCTTPASPILLLTHGLSGTGKTVLSGMLLERRDLIRLRSDVERKRLHGLAADADSRSGLDSGLYTAAASARIYEHLARTAEALLRAGYGVIVDAAFLRHAQRELMYGVARRLGRSCVVLALRAPERLLRERIAERHSRGHDASEADVHVLARQQETIEALSAKELGRAVILDAAGPPPCADIFQAVDERAATPTIGGAQTNDS
jgi:aminoglycoside phosphotransferase family enzyme/predicted kinase